VDLPLSAPLIGSGANPKPSPELPVFRHPCRPSAELADLELSLLYLLCQFDATDHYLRGSCAGLNTFTQNFPTKPSFVTLA
jgi:hypothetical protein